MKAFFLLYHTDETIQCNHVFFFKPEFFVFHANYMRIYYLGMYGWFGAALGVLTRAHVICGVWACQHQHNTCGLIVQQLNSSSICLVIVFFNIQSNAEYFIKSLLCIITLVCICKDVIICIYG